MSDSPRRVLITGASRGIGLVTAESFLEVGDTVFVTARDPKVLATAAATMTAKPGQLHVLPANLADMDQVKELALAALDAMGGVDVLVNNAGQLNVGPFEDEDPAAMAELLDVNLKAAMRLTQLLLPDMLDRGQGWIVNVASGAGLNGFSQIVSYSASKFGMVGFTEALAREVDSQGVKVYAVCPGRVATDMQEKYSGRRIGLPPERVAAKIHQLTTPNHRSRTGNCVTVA